MAKNYTMTEAVEIINEGTDMEAIADIGRRYPILLCKVAKVTAIAGESFVDFMRFMPEHLTANKVNTLMKNSVDVEADDDNEETEEAPKAAKPAKETKAKAAKAEDAEDTESDSDNEYESMSGKELWDLLGKHGKRKDCKDKMGGAKKDDMIAYINKYGLGDAEEVEEADEAEDTAEENPYEGISAPELFKECKKRGIKAAAKKPAKYYVELLMKSDEEVASDSTESEDDWGDEAEEATPAKTDKKKSGSKNTKPAKEETADEDDDWDI